MIGPAASARFYEEISIGRMFAYAFSHHRAGISAASNIPRELMVEYLLDYLLAIREPREQFTTVVHQIGGVNPTWPVTYARQEQVTGGRTDITLTSSNGKRLILELKVGPNESVTKDQQNKYLALNKVLGLVCIVSASAKQSTTPRDQAKVKVVSWHELGAQLAKKYFATSWAPFWTELVNFAEKVPTARRPIDLTMLELKDGWTAAKMDLVSLQQIGDTWERSPETLRSASSYFIWASKGAVTSSKSVFDGVICDPSCVGPDTYSFGFGNGHDGHWGLRSTLGTLRLGIAEVVANLENTLKEWETNVPVDSWNAEWDAFINRDPLTLANFSAMLAAAAAAAAAKPDVGQYDPKSPVCLEILVNAINDLAVFAASNDWQTKAIEDKCFGIKFTTGNRLLELSLELDSSKSLPFVISDERLVCKITNAWNASDDQPAAQFVDTFIGEVQKWLK